MTRLLLGLSLARLVFQTAGENVAARAPAQFIYDASTASSRVQRGGCIITSWDGMDSDGMSGPPWVSYVNCTAGAKYKVSGVPVHGDFQVWLHYGRLSFNSQVVFHPGESFWIAPGAYAEMEVEGAAFVAGAKFELDPSAEAAAFTSAFAGPKFRNYTYADAVLNRSNALLQHDDHICNGSSPSKDLVFGSQTGVDPPSVSVLNCAPSSMPDGNFVWSHFHPFGALYIAFSGEICFATSKVQCIQPGTARWTSANLQYYEFFRKVNTTNIHADKVRDLAGVPEEKCQYPILFSVTNFDGFNAPPGVPNFGDWPVNAHTNPYALGIGPWGIFPKMTVQATKVVVKASTVMVEEEVDERPRTGVPQLV